MANNIQVSEGELKPLSPRDMQKNAMIDMAINETSMTMNMSHDQKDSIERTEQIVPQAVTRFIDLVDKNETTGRYEVRKDSFGHPIDIMGALGNIPTSQMPYMQISNMNHIAITLEEDIYLTIYEKDDRGMLRLDEKGDPIIVTRQVVNLGQETQIVQLLNNLACEYKTAKLQGQVMVGQAGGSPLGVGGSWDNTLDVLFGGKKK
jgi:hypothetical protein